MHEPLELPAFERIVNDTVATLPQQFQDALKEVVIVIELRQPPMRLSGHGTLLGLYEGVPLTEWGRDYSGKLPDKITLFKENIEAYAKTPEELPDVIRETLLHEIAHYFGYDHDKIHDMEKRWRKQSRAKKRAKPSSDFGLPPDRTP